MNTGIHFHSPVEIAFHKTLKFIMLLVLIAFLLNPITINIASASHNLSSGIGPTPSTASLVAANLTRPLDFESRLTCRRLVLEVYWRHMLWPADNPAPKPALDQVLPLADLRSNVEDELRRSGALAQLWQRTVTGAQLQAEIERMVRSTRQPDVLHEIFAALDNDPYLVAECLARPALTERLLSGWYDADPHTSQDFDSWWQAERGQFSIAISAPEYAYTLPAPSRSPEQDDTWTPTPALPEGVFGSTAVWTGAEMIIFGGVGAGSGGRTNSGSRYNPATDTWTTTAALEAASPRSLHTAVWTGSEMIVWGGCSQNTEFCDLSTGGRYNPLTDSWTPTDTATAPDPRMDHTAVWTGSEMIVWGGCSIGSQGNNFCNILRDDGGVYDPDSDTWQDLNTAGAPSARTGHKAVWADGLMIVWGGYNINATNTGGRYNLASNTWQPTSLVDAPEARSNHTLVWTGSQAIVWGGCDISLCLSGDTYYDTGGLYDPDTDDWTPTDTAGAPQARSNHTAVWTGSEMIVWGGRISSGTNLNTGARYDPGTDTWTATDTSTAPSGRSSHHAVWADTEMIVWGGATAPGLAKSGGRYDPASDGWVPTSTNDPVVAKERHTAVWTGTQMLIWGGSTLGYGEFFGLGTRYDAVTGSWSLMSTTDEPPGRFFHTAVWTGSEMIVWGGQYGTSLYNSGGRYNPLSDSWLDTSTSNVPSERAQHTAVWTGSEMLVWGGDTLSGFTNSGGRYNPDTNSWTAISTSGAPGPRGYLRGAWTGSEMIVWGGYTDSGDTNTGGRYDPTSNSWSDTSTSGAPVGRHFNSAIWTGSEFIVWGGMSGNLDNGTWYNTGGRYNPGTNSWSDTSTTEAPSPRIWHVDAWTGEELIVWGGCTGSTSCPDEVYTGGRYDPISDTWKSTSLQSVPSQRSNSSAVWTGADMIVWGGLAGNVGTYTTSGGFYHVDTVPNTPPVAAPDSYSTDEDLVLNIPAPGVLENDSDADGNPLSALLVSNPEHGSLELVSDGSFTYTPDQDFNGSDSFIYRAFDGILMSGITVVDLNVAAVNDAPLATDDIASTLEDIPTTIAVLGNDSDIDSLPLSISAVGTPESGTAVISGTLVLYSPVENFYGSDVFTYTVSDGSLLDMAMVTVTISAVNDAPLAAGEVYTTGQDVALVIPAPGVLANDSDVDGDTLTASVSVQPQHGSLVLEADGGFLYTPEAGYSGADLFVYQASDGVTFSEPTVVQITIEASPPVIQLTVFLPIIIRE